jgi:hypothetical protein
MLHVSQTHVAARLGVSTDTLKRRAGHVYDAGKLKGKELLQRSMLKSALKGNATMQIWLSKNWLGYSDTPATTVDPSSVAREIRAALEAMDHASAPAEPATEPAPQ